MEYDPEDDDFDEDEDDDEDQEMDSSGSGSEQDSESDSYVPGRGGGRGEVPQKVRHSTNSNPEECKQQWAGIRQLNTNIRDSFGSSLRKLSDDFFLSFAGFFQSLYILFFVVGRRVCIDILNLTFFFSSPFFLFYFALPHVANKLTLS